MSDYTYVRAPFPNTVSWHREIVWDDEKVIGEIRESIESRANAKRYHVCKYEPMQVADGFVEIADTVKVFSSIADCKDFINNGGLK